MKEGGERGDEGRRREGMKEGGERGDEGRRGEGR